MIPGESVTGRSNKLPVTVTKPPVNEVQNHGNQLPPNYPDNYSNNYNDGKKVIRDKAKTQQGIENMYKAIGIKRLS